MVSPPFFGYFDQGFYMNETENRKKRYCLICHVYKPERCHHCSTCGACKLGMDHHCPWLCTCIGYFNRKFFMLTLFYSLLTLALILSFNFLMIVQVIQTIYFTQVDSKVIGDFGEWNRINIRIPDLYSRFNFVFLYFKFFSISSPTRFHK